MINNIVIDQLFRARYLARSNDSGASAGTAHPCADPVTGLPNRAMLDWYLAHLFALAPEPSLNSALLVIELNEARAIRYAFGDSVCNQFMQITGQRFREVAKPGQFVSALNRDEFAFVFSKTSGRNQCIEVARKLLARAGEPIRIDGRQYFCSANIGIAFADVESETPADMLHRAQVASHGARLEGFGGIKLVDSGSAKLASEALSMLNEVHGACRHGEFDPHY